MEVRANGLLVIEGQITEPKNGPWTARLEIDEEETDLAGKVEIVIGSQHWKGIATGAVEQGRYVARVIAGASGLKKELDAKYYYQSSLSMVLQDIMRETGETFDQTLSEAAVTTFIVPRWARLRGEARLALAQITKEVAGFWRHSREGRIFIRKAEQWTTLKGDYVEIARDPSSSTVEIAPEDEPFALPGAQLGQDKIIEVVTTWDGSGLRQRLTVDNGSKVRGTAAQFGDAMRRASEPALNYSQWYPAKVIKQDGDGTVELYPDDVRIRGNGITKVPLRHGLPGVSTKVSPGQRVVLFFEDGDPKKPAAAGWPQGSDVIEVVQEALQRIALVAPELLVGALTAAHPMVLGDVLKTCLEALTVSTAMGPSGTPINAPTFQQFISQKHKLDG
jgi:hypothetical protein